MKLVPRKRTKDEEAIPNEMAGTFTVTAMLEHESVLQLPLVKNELLTWFQIGSNPPLTRSQVDELSHLVADFLGANGYERGFVRTVQDDAAYERGDVQTDKWRAVRTVDLCDRCARHSGRAG